MNATVKRLLYFVVLAALIVATVALFWTGVKYVIGAMFSTKCNVFASAIAEKCAKGKVSTSDSHFQSCPQCVGEYYAKSLDCEYFLDRDQSGMCCNNSVDAKCFRPDWNETVIGLMADVTCDKSLGYVAVWEVSSKDFFDGDDAYVESEIVSTASEARDLESEYIVNNTYPCENDHDSGNSDQRKWAKDHSKASVAAALLGSASVLCCVTLCWAMFGYRKQWSLSQGSRGKYHRDGESQPLAFSSMKN